MKLSKLLKTLDAVKASVELLRGSGVRIPNKLDKNLAIADSIVSELKNTESSSSRKPSTKSAE
jgi:hypothetical protein